MRRELNYTGRIDIPMALFSAKHRLQVDAHEINLKWDFSSLGLDPKSEIVCDVFVANTVESNRFELGTLKSGKNNREIDVFEMRNPMLSKIRIKIIDPSSSLHIIRAVLNNFHPELPTDAESSNSLLSILKMPGLKTPWEINFERGVPTLYITDSGNLYQLLRNPVKAEWFKPLIMHHVLKEIFNWLARFDSFENQEKAEKWKKLFIDYYNCPRDFFEKVSEMERDEREEFIRDQSILIADSVSSKHRDLSKLASFFANLGGE